MPRDVDGVWTDIPNITAVPGEVIESADWNNYRADLRDNEFNAVRPVTAGGTGASSILGAKTALGIANVDNTADINKPTSNEQLNDMYFLAMTS